MTWEVFYILFFGMIDVNSSLSGIEFTIDAVWSQASLY